MPELDVFATVVGQHRDAVARLHPQTIGEPGRQSLDPLEMLPMGDRVIIGPHRDPTEVGLGARDQELLCGQLTHGRQPAYRQRIS